MSRQLKGSADLIKYMTTYLDSFGGLHSAIQVPWKDVDEILGDKHAGTPEDDVVLCRWLKARGCGTWIDYATGWTDERGWGVYYDEPELGLIGGLI